MMKIFTADQELISIGSSYLRIMGITYLCWGITEIYLAILRSIGRVTISMVLNMLAFILNIILNATFIFGLFGAPKLGATGVAIATAVSRLIELAACVIVSFLSKAEHRTDIADNRNQRVGCDGICSEVSQDYRVHGESNTPGNVISKSGK